MKLYLAILACLLAGCGRNGPSVDSPLVPLYNKFTTDATNHGVTLDQNRINVLTMTFDTINEKAAAGGFIIGYCDIASDGYHVIVDKDFWANANDLDRESLVFHELGHCLLGRKHKMDIDLNTGLPMSIMYPYLVGYRWYNKDDATYSSYNSELFTDLYDLDSNSMTGCKMEAP